jgi:hypothetical protein
MSRGRQNFRQSDVVRAIKATRAAGESIARVEIDRHGKIVVIVGNAETSLAPAADSALEKWLADED